VGTSTAPGSVVTIYGRVTVSDKLDAVLAAYIECALWASTDNSDDSGGDPMDDNYGPDDLAPETLETMRADVSAFLEEVESAGMFPEYNHPRAVHEDEFSDDAMFGHDFWLTRNHHGAGFWDRGLGEIGDKLTRMSQVHGTADLYIGDDGKVYHS
jgi:hypothetical protein